MYRETTVKNYMEISGNLKAEQSIVFGHGFGTDHTIWNLVKKEFEKEFKIITYDNVGTGKSNPNSFSPIRYSRLNSYADDIINICAELNIRNSLFVGHSVSGMVGLLASKKAPEFFDRHVFINASPRYLNDIDYVGGFEQSDLEQLYHAMETNYYVWASGFAPVFMDNPERPDLAQEFIKTLTSIRPDIALAVCKVIFESDHRKDLKGFEKKSLLIQSHKDPAVPVEVGKYMNKNLVNSQLSVIQSKGHFPHVSTPNEVINEIKSFIA